MSTSQQNLIVDASTLTNWKITGQAISTFIQGVWTQTADTGQINWSTVTLPATNTFGGYEIYKPNDALTPYYMRISYGRSTVSGVTLGVQIGTTTDGAGTLTGIVTSISTTVGATSAPSNGAALTWECDFSGSGSRLGILLARNASTGNAQFVGVERSLNSSGVYTSDYITVVTCGYNGATPGNESNQATVVSGIGVFNCSAGAKTRPVTIRETSTSASLGSDVAISPVFPSLGKFGNPMTQCSSGRAADFVDGSTYTTTLYGSTITLLCSKSGSGSTGSTYGFGPDSLSCLLMRYD